MKKVVDKTLKNDFKENYVFLVMVCLVFLFGIYGLVKTPQKKSTLENRTLTQFGHFTIKNFLNGRFQDNFENALSDQFLMSEKIRTIYGDTMNNLPMFGIEDIICHGRYISLNGNKQKSAMFDCDDRMVVLPENISKKWETTMKNNLEKYNHVNKLADTYYYVIEESDMFDFQKDERTIDIKDILRKNLVGNYTLSFLHINNYDEYKGYYYKTDHHLDVDGQYQVYKDVVEMLGVKNIAVPKEVINSHEYFFGSRARDARNYSFLEEFRFNNFSLPNHKTYINKIEREYGHYKEFINHDYKYKKTFSFYGWVYGGDMGEVIFDYNRPEKDNILVISNSFDNPITPIIAQHFNKTFNVDPRHYKDDLKEDFVISEYIKKNKINKVLFIMSSRMLFQSPINQGLEL